MKKLILLIAMWSLYSGCSGQVGQFPAVAGPPANTGIPDYYGMPAGVDYVDTSAGWSQQGQRLLVTGTVYQPGGQTPAPNVLIYYYHTNTEGRYVHKADEKRSLPPNSQGHTHGYIRGWVRTGRDGKYSIYTVKPGAYPTGDEPAHIHVTVTEPGMDKPCYIDDLVFDDDRLLTSARRGRMENRGGSGVLRLLQDGNLQIAEQNIVLGLNVPGYSKAVAAEVESGLQVGEDQPSFMPIHAYGPDKGTRNCPVCNYGRYHGIIYFVGNKANWNEIRQWLVFLENESNVREKYLKSFFVYGSSRNYDRKNRSKELEELGSTLNLKRLALTFVPSFSDTATEANLNKINPDVENTFIIYKHRSIIAKFINLAPTKANFKIMSTILDQTRNEYFYLPELPHR